MSYIQIAGGTGGAGGGIAASLLGNNTSGALALVSTGTLRLAGGNNITLSQNGQSVTISAANSNPGTFSTWEPYPINAVSLVTRQIGQSTLLMNPLYVPLAVSANQYMDMISLTIGTTAGSSFAAAISQSVGIYTLTGSTPNLITASSGATNVQFTNTDNQSTASLQGPRGFTVPLTLNATPGNYWIGFLSATASTQNNAASISNFMVNQVNSVFSGFIGQAVAASRGVIRGAGILSVQTAALPASVGLSDLLASNLLTCDNIYMNFQLT